MSHLGRRIGGGRDVIAMSRPRRSLVFPRSGDREDERFRYCCRSLLVAFENLIIIVKQSSVDQRSPAQVLRRLATEG
jgi:hypothetical protein